MKGSAAMDDHSVICWLDIGTHTFQPFCYHSDTVGFFYLQFLRVFDHSSSFCESRHHCDHRDLIDQCGDNLALNGSSVETACADQQICSRLPFCAGVK